MSGLLRKDLLMVETMETSALQDCQKAALVLHSPGFCRLPVSNNPLLRLILQGTRVSDLAWFDLGFLSHKGK